MKVKKVIYVFLGIVFLLIGSIGIYLPVLPTTPFLLLASFFFSKGSEKFNNWFVSTKLYKNNLESFIKLKAMTLKTKAKILAYSSTLLIIAFIMINNIYARLFIGCVMVCKYWYFIFKIPTIDENYAQKIINVNKKEK